MTRKQLAILVHLGVFSPLREGGQRFWPCSKITPPIPRWSNSVCGGIGHLCGDAQLTASQREVVAALAHVRASYDKLSEDLGRAIGLELHYADDEQGD